MRLDRLNVTLRRRIGQRLFLVLLVIGGLTSACGRGAGNGAADVSRQDGSAFPPQDVLQGIRPEPIRAHMAYLADDLLEGRGTGSRGYNLAALYVKSQFEQVGLKPAGENNSYFQTVRLRQIELDRTRSSFALKHGGSVRRLAIDREFAMRGDPLRTDVSVEAPVVFVGFGVTAPEFQYDDYAGVDVRGKIVAALYGAPPRFPSAPGAHYSSTVIKLGTAASHGAVGFLTVLAGRAEKRFAFPRYADFFRPPSMRWLDASGTPNDAVPQIRASAAVSSTVAEAMFQQTGKSWTDTIANAEASRPQAVPLDVSASIHVVARHSDIISANIVGMLPGSDPRLKDEYVIYTAHLDHMGIGEPIDGDAIYNGAGDNASGTAAVLEIARAFSRMPTATRRSIVFAMVTAEESGLLGSDYYAHHPTVPVSSIVANVNVDGVAFMYDFRDVVALGSEHSTIGAVVADVASHMGLEVSPDPLPEEVFFIRSDQYSFVKQGIPSVFIVEGYKTVDPTLDGKKMADEWEATRYHRPNDDMNQSLNFDAAARATRVQFAVGYEIAQATERPSWNKADFFATLGRPITTR